MTGYSDFAAAAPHISAIFARRHAAAGNLCMLATLRSDGYPRISPMEPTIFEDELTLVGMPGTTKFADLARDPRLCLHTATVDTRVRDGDAKLWGIARDRSDVALHRRFADDLFARTGLDLRGQALRPFYVLDITGASAVEVAGEEMTVTIWKPGEPERRVTKR